MEVSINGKLWAGIVFVAAACGLLLLGASRQAGAGRVNASGVVPAWVVAAASQHAAGAGDPTPSSARAILTTRRSAMDAQSAGYVDSDQGVYYVVLRGRFADHSAYAPSNQVIYGSVMTLTLDASSRGVLDYSLGDRVPALSPLGPASDITRAVVAAAPGSARGS